jgi:transposase
MRDLYAIQPCLYAFEMCNLINLHFKTEFDEKQVQRALTQDLHFTYKVMEQLSTQKNEFLRAYWAATILGSNIKKNPACMFVIVDETHLSLEEAFRRRGRARKGHKAFSNHWLFVRGSDVGCCAIASMSVEGILSISTYTETVNGDIFLAALENDILPRMNPYPQHKSILILDNAKTHLKAAILNICSQFGVLVLFLPPYSYDLSPIEPVFHLAKEYIRRKWGHTSAETPLVFQLEEALRHCLSTKFCAAHEFNKVGIAVSDWEMAWIDR